MLRHAVLLCLVARALGFAAPRRFVARSHPGARAASFAGRRAAPARASPDDGDAALAGRLTSFAALAERYDAFLLDQFGVMHDGQVAYPGAAECCSALW